MKATTFPDVTTSRCVCEESSIEVIGWSNDIFLVTVRVRRSHHLITQNPVPQPRRTTTREIQVITHLIILSSPPLTPVFSSNHTTLLIVPSCDWPPPSDRISGSASGFPMSNIRTFFSCPPVSRCDGEIATLRTICTYAQYDRETHAVKSALPDAARDPS